MSGIIFFIICLLIKAYLEAFFTKEETASKPLIYEVNGKQTPIPMERYYIELLGLSLFKSITIEIIAEAYYHKLSEVADRRLSGETIYFDIAELKAAKAYLVDACEYLGSKN